jgi:hypothetical protein
VLILESIMGKGGGVNRLRRMISKGMSFAIL